MDGALTKLMDLMASAGPLALVALCVLGCVVVIGRAALKAKKFRLVVEYIARDK